MTKGSMYTFQKWLMIGIVVLVISAIFAQFPLESSVPNVSDYDLLDEKESQQYLDDVDSYEGQVALFGACLLYTSPSPRDFEASRMPSSA